MFQQQKIFYPVGVSLGKFYQSMKFTMEIESNSIIPFIDMIITKDSNKLETSVHRKFSNIGLLLYFHSHVDNRCKKSLLKTMVYSASRISYFKGLFLNKCHNLKLIIRNLKQPENLVTTAIFKFGYVTEDTPKQRFSLPFKDRRLVDNFRTYVRSTNDSPLISRAVYRVCCFPARAL